jgi:hypothetical protein
VLAAGFIKDYHLRLRMSLEDLSRLSTEEVREANSAVAVGSRRRCKPDLGSEPLKLREGASQRHQGNDAGKILADLVKIFERLKIPFEKRLVNQSHIDILLSVTPTLPTFHGILFFLGIRL